MKQIILLAVVLWGLAVGADAQTTPVSSMPAAGSLNSTDLLYLDQVSQTVKNTKLTLGVLDAHELSIIPTATTSVLGLVKVDGTTITISGGVISASPPDATTTTPGVVIVPAAGGLSISAGDLSVHLGAGLSIVSDALTAAVVSVAGRTGAIMLTSADISGLGPLATASMSGATTGQVPTYNGSAWVPQTPSSGGTITDSNVAYVDASGNDGTGAVGNPALPFATAQAAYNAGASLLKLGVGSWTITLSADWRSGCSVTGAGYANTTLTITGDGATGSPGTNGHNISIASDQTVALAISVNGGNGATDTDAGGTAGNVTLSNCVISSLSSVGGGDDGSG